MPAAYDVNGQPLNFGDPVNIPCKLISLGTIVSGIQNLVVETRYRQTDGTPIVATVPANLVMADK